MSSIRARYGAPMSWRAPASPRARALLPVGSNASLYLVPDPRGDLRHPAHPQAERRATTRGQGECDLMLLGLQRAKGCRCDPAARPRRRAGTSPFHSGLGFFNVEQHVSSGNGRNPLALRAGGDVAAAIHGAMRAPERSGAATTWSAGCADAATPRLAGQATAARCATLPKFPAMLLPRKPGNGSERLGGRRSPPPSRRDSSRAAWPPVRLRRCQGSDLGWTPEADPAASARRLRAGLCGRAPPLLLNPSRPSPRAGRRCVSRPSQPARRGVPPCVEAMDGVRRRARCSTRRSMSASAGGVTKGDTHATCAASAPPCALSAPTCWSPAIGAASKGAARIGTGVPHLHMEDGFGPRNGRARSRAACRPPAAAAPARRWLVPSRQLCARHRDMALPPSRLRLAERRRPARFVRPAAPAGAGPVVIVTVAPARGEEPRPADPRHGGLRQNAGR